MCLSQFLRFDYYPSKLEYRSVKIEKILNIWVELIFLQNLESFSHHSFTTFLETAKRSTASIVVLVVGPVGAFFLLIIVLVYLRTKMQGQVKCKFHVCYFYNLCNFVEENYKNVLVSITPLRICICTFRST